MNTIHFFLWAGAVLSFVVGLYLLYIHRRRDEIKHIQDCLFYGIRKNMISLNLREEKGCILFSLPDNKQDDISLFFQHVLRQLGYVTTEHTPYFENGFSFIFQNDSVFRCHVRRYKNKDHKEYCYFVIVK